MTFEDILNALVEDFKLRYAIFWHGPSHGEGDRETLNRRQMMIQELSGKTINQLLDDDEEGIE